METMITLELAKKKAQNYANFLGKKHHIFVYNENCQGMTGHHIVVDDKKHFNKNKELTFIESVNPNGQPVESV